MNTVITTNDIFLFFAQGAYFLLIAIFAFKLLRQYNVRIKLFTGILLLVWVILNIKDLVIYNTQVNSAIERVNWITMIDQLAVPIIGITMFELSHPKSITPFKATLHLLPFTILLSIHFLSQSRTYNSNNHLCHSILGIYHYNRSDFPSLNIKTYPRI